LYLERGVEFDLFSCIVVVIYAYGLIHSKVINVFSVKLTFKSLVFDILFFQQAFECYISPNCFQPQHKKRLKVIQSYWTAWALSKDTQFMSW